MSPCRYVTWSVSISPCGYRHRVYYETHGDFHVDMDSHMEISMVMQAGSVSMSPCVSPCLHVDTDMECLHVSMWILHYHSGGFGSMFAYYHSHGSGSMFTYYHSHGSGFFLYIPYQNFMVESRDHKQGYIKTRTQ